VVVLLTAACGRNAEPQPPPAPAVARHDAGAPVRVIPKLDTYADLATALAAVIPADARVVGFGELHSRTDRPQIRSTLSHFTAEAFPALAPRLSDLILETWLIDKGCGSAAAEATTKVEITMRRPMETHNDIGELAEAARKAKVQPHAMRVTCADYARISPPGKPVDTEAMLDLTTRELGRIATEAIVHRDREPDHRPLIALYGGALHNDRTPDPALAAWSYAKQVDQASHDHFVEIDLIAPELAESDALMQKQPWFPAVTQATTKVQVWKRDDRSFVIVLPREQATP
jgi:hypothetical protein